MAVAEFLDPKRILLRSRVSKDEILDELIAAACSSVPFLDAETVKEKVFLREEGVSTNMEQGIAVPHAILDNLPSAVLALAVCKEGIEWEHSGGKPVFLVVLLLGNSVSHLSVLSEVARLLRNETILSDILSSESADEVFDKIAGYDTKPSAPVPARNDDISKTVFQRGWDIARSVGGKVVLHADAFTDSNYIIGLVGETDTIIVSTDPGRFPRNFTETHTLVEIPVKGERRSVHLQFALLSLLSKQAVEAGEPIVHVYGLPESGIFDSLRLSYTDNCFDFNYPLSVKNVVSDFGNHILTRTLQIAGELAAEGREGKPVGALFVVGDYEKVKSYTRQLIINPFKGYEEQLRNIIDPSLEETVKEFAKIDGAFIVRGDGTIVSCGTYITGDLEEVRLPPGLGARHAAALGITAVSSAFAVALSESTRKISVFRAGQRIVEI
jgi:diadenylate cyclase